MTLIHTYTPSVDKNNSYYSTYNIRVLNSRLLNYSYSTDSYQ